MVESFCPIITGFACTIWRRISIWVRLSRRLRALRRVEIRSWISRERKDVLHTRTARDARGGGERATRGRRGREREEARPELEVDRKHRPSQKSIVGSAPQRAPSAGVKSPGRVLGCVWETHKTFTSRARRRTRIDKTRAGRVCRVPYESSSLRVKLGSS